MQVVEVLIQAIFYESNGLAALQQGTDNKKERAEICNTRHSDKGSPRVPVGDSVVRVQRAARSVWGQHFIARLALDQ
jgi:hypothetical protein